MWPACGDWHLDDEVYRQQNPVQTAIESQQTTTIPGNVDSGMCAFISHFMLALVLRFNISDVWDAGSAVAVFFGKRFSDVVMHERFRANLVLWAYRLFRAKEWGTVFNLLGLTNNEPSVAVCGVFDDSGTRMCCDQRCPDFALCALHRSRLVEADPTGRHHRTRPCQYPIPHSKGLVPWKHDETWMSNKSRRARRMSKRDMETVDDEPAPTTARKRICTMSPHQDAQQLLARLSLFLKVHHTHFENITTALDRNDPDRKRQIRWGWFVTQAPPSMDTKPSYLVSHAHPNVTVFRWIATEFHYEVFHAIGQREQAENELMINDGMWAIGAKFVEYNPAREYSDILALMYVNDAFWPGQTDAHVLRFAQYIVSMVNFANPYAVCSDLRCATFDNLGLGEAERLPWYVDIQRACVCLQAVLKRMPHDVLRIGRSSTQVLLPRKVAALSLATIVAEVQRHVKNEDEKTLLLLMAEGEHYAALRLQKKKLTFWISEDRLPEWTTNIMSKVHIPCQLKETQCLPMWKGNAAIHQQAGSPIDGSSVLL